MSTPPIHDLVERLLTAESAGDADAHRAVLHPDFVEEYPQSRERIRGRDRVLGMRRASPAPIGDLRWRVTTLGDSLAVAEIGARYGEEPWWVIGFYEGDAGGLRHQTAYFGQAFPAPDWRAPWAEPLSVERWLEDAGGHGDVDRETVERYLTGAFRGDLDEMAALRHPDWHADFPQSGERFQGHANFVAAHRNFPGGMPHGEGKLLGPEDEWVVAPSFAPTRIAGRGPHWAGEGWITYGDGQRYLTAALIAYRDGLIVSERYFYFTPFEPPAWRDGISERF